MKECTIDFETRSPVDLKKHGVFVYAEHPATEIMCLSVAFDQQKPLILIADKFRQKINPQNIKYEIVNSSIRNEILSCDKIVAQNSMFEYLMWNWILAKRYNWPELPLNKLHDTMAQLAYHALPLSLNQGGEALNLPIKKDNKGHAIMLKLCKPRKPRKAEKAADPEWANKIWWHEEPEDIETLCNYCCTDVEAERLVHHTLDPLPAKEREIWLLNEKINLKGVPIDVENVKAIVKTINNQNAVQRQKFANIVKDYPFQNGKILSSPLYHVGVKEWVNEQLSLQLTSIDKDSTTRLLERNDLPTHVKEVLEIRAELSKASVSKFEAMLDRMNADGRVRGWSAYHAASTGRWAAWGLQLHNNPRDCYKPDDYEHVLNLFKKESIDSINLLWGNPYHAASRCVRGALAAPPEKEFICTDFKAIEGVGLAYLAGEQWVLDAYANGEDMYKYAASDLFGIKYDQINKSQRQVGKVEELFLGFAGGIGAFASGAKSYKIDLETLPPLVFPRATPEELDGPYGAKALAKMYIAKNRGVMSFQAAIACDVIKRKWREDRPMIKLLWKMAEECAIRAIKEPGRVFSYKDISYAVSNNFLKCRLPSGRVMHYYKPILTTTETPWSTKEKKIYKETITYMGMKIVDGKNTRQWTRLTTFSGKLVENFVQGFCRDLLADAMLRHAQAGFDICMHVHDEDMSEVDEGTGNLEEYNRIAEIVPPYAVGMPIKAEGWVGKRYRK